MKCEKCKILFPEGELQESHDVPCYLFEAPTRKLRKKQADNYRRHNLCKKCHDIYERILFSILVSTLNSYQRLQFIDTAIKFSNKYFRDDPKTT